MHRKKVAVAASPEEKIRSGGRGGKCTAKRSRWQQAQRRRATAAAGEGNAPQKGRGGSKPRGEEPQRRSAAAAGEGNAPQKGRGGSKPRGEEPQR
ncbi:hypothetical protein VOLCADRAFT_70890, partial [Volvox carteri f. nagariensis]